MGTGAACGDIHLEWAETGVLGPDDCGGFERM